MKTLFITRDYLHGHGGGVYASRAYINAFAEISDYMTLVYPIKDDANAQGLSEKISRLYPVNFSIPKWRKGIRMLCGKVSPYDALSEDFFDSSIYDVVVFNNSCVSQGLLSKFRNANIKVITIHHNFELEYLRDNLRLIQWVPNYIATYFVEKKAFRESDLNLTLTSDDISLLRQNYGGNAASEVIGVFEYINKKRNECIIRNQEATTFLITGDLSMPQTYDSLYEWIKLYYPSLQRIVPTIHLIIAGKKPSKDLKILCEENHIELIPSPIDMDAILKKADYYICPISKGGGLKLRILDGLKFGMPVVTHAVSARGYDSLVDGGIIFKYTNVEDFENCIMQLLSLQLSKSEIIAEYNRLFSFTYGVKKLKKILRDHNFLS